MGMRSLTTDTHVDASVVQDGEAPWPKCFGLAGVAGAALAGFGPGAPSSNIAIVPALALP